jgi:membrane protein
MFLLIIFGGSLGNAIAKRTPLGGGFTLFWNIARWPIAFGAVLIFFSLVYYLAPNLKQRSWRWLSPGSIVGAILWLVLSGLFALYTSFSSSYSKTYGSIAGAIILLLWLNYSSWAILFGAELNSELDREADIHAAGGPSAGLVKPARRGTS